MRPMLVLVAVLTGTSAGHAQEKPDFTVGGLKWRCQSTCDKMTAPPFVKIEQSGSVVVFTAANGTSVKGEAKTEVRQPTPSKGPSLRCQMNPSYCGKEPPPKVRYYRTIEIPEWKCTVSVQEKDGEPDTPPPFKAKWMRFLSPGCAYASSIWTTLSASQVKALEKRCGEWNVNC